LIDHPHDLIDKAIGWMLREIGKMDQEVVFAFLREYAQTMSRAALRYGIEKFDETLRFQIFWRENF
jgi:3-methyladenine DNA glycosylase AlkD